METVLITITIVTAQTEILVVQETPVIALEKNGKLGPMLVNQDKSPYPETKAVFGSGTKEWQKNYPKYVAYMEKGQYVTPVNAAMYAKLKYTPWTDFPA